LAVERVPVLRDDFAAPPLERELLFVPAFARVEVDLRALLVERDALDRDAALRAPDDLRVPLLLPPLLRRVEEDFAVEPVLEPSSAVHLPDSTRCAASATASAMIEPSFVALDTTLLAACDAVSAASRPASRILRRAAGLALIAAAAAARPAASISLLIAAFAKRSSVSFVPEDDEPEEFLVEDFAIASLPPFRERHFKAVTVPK
jgi:hypothetical protein